MRSRTLITCLVALAAAPAAAAAEPESPWVLEVSDASPGAGEHVWFRLAWENQEGEQVRVPKGLLERATMSGEYCAPGDRCPKVMVGRALPQAGALPKASTIAWTDVPAGTAVEHIGDLAQVFPKACKDGCAPGRYVLRAWVPSVDYADRAADQQVPSSFERQLTVVVHSALLPVRSTSWLKVTAKAGKPTADSLPMQVTVTNTGKHALILPKPSAFFTLCSQRMVHADGKVTGADQGAGAGGQSSYHESEAVVLAPGAAHTYSVACRDFEVPGPGVVQHHVVMRLEPFREFAPKGRPATPFWLDAPIRTPELRLR